jgi:hypothetical protein
LAAGNFSLVNGVAAGNIARWNGTAWQPMGSGFNDQVYALALLPNGSVVAGGVFSQSGTQIRRSVAR